MPSVGGGGEAGQGAEGVPGPKGGHGFLAWPFAGGLAGLMAVLALTAPPRYALPHVTLTVATGLAVLGAPDGWLRRAVRGAGLARSLARRNAGSGWHRACRVKAARRAAAAGGARRPYWASTDAATMMA